MTTIPLRASVHVGRGTLTLATVLLALLAASCDGADPAGADGAADSVQLQSMDMNAEARSIAGAPPAKGESPARPLPGQAQIGPATTMLIRTGHASVEVDSLDAAIASVRALAARMGGYVANSSVRMGEEQVRSAQLELRLPAEQFDAAIGGLGPVGEVETVDVQAQDVGEEFVDLSARLENARRLEARLIDILATRTGRLEDVLAVERELARVREEIERMEGRLRYLQTRVAMSTLTVDVHEPAPLVAKHPGDDVILRAFRTAWTNFVLLVAGLIASLGFVIPLGGLALLAWVIGRRFLARPARAGAEAA